MLRLFLSLLVILLSSCEGTTSSLLITPNQLTDKGTLKNTKIADTQVTNEILEIVEVVEVVEVVEEVVTVESIDTQVPTETVKDSKSSEPVKLVEKSKNTDIQGSGLPIKVQGKQTNTKTEPDKTNSNKNISNSEIAAINVNTANEENLWNYISNRYALNGYQNSKVDEQVAWFKKNSGYLARASARAKPYLYLIVREVEKSDLPIEIALLPLIESAFYPFSYSHGTASGLWQFIPSTAKLYGLKDNWWQDDRRDVVASTRAAIRYLSNLKKIFKGDLLLAIAAYNSGPGRVQREIKKNKKLGKNTDFWSLHLPPETRSYVPRLLAAAKIIKSPSIVNQQITPIDNKEYARSVLLESQFDLALIAKWSELTIDEVYSLNPGLKRWATPSVENYSILLPVDRIAKFNNSLSKHPNKEKISWLRYKIQPGDSLSEIALDNRTTIEQIKELNELPNNNIRAGRYLIVPVAQKEARFYSLSEEQRKKQRMEGKKNFKKIVHSVTKGDSLWEIARKYNVLIDNIVKWNQLSLTKPLRVGKELLIYKKTIKNKDTDFAANKVGIDINRTIIYYVRQGDNLSVIANKFDVTVGDIKLWNNIDINKVLQPGQRLKIVVNVINSEMK